MKCKVCNGTGFVGIGPVSVELKSVMFAMEKVR